mgnify:CR=1 FL=1
MSLEGMLIVSAVLFSIGLYGTLARSNVIAGLMSLEIMFYAIHIALVAMAKFVAPQRLQIRLSSVLTCHVFVIFLITVAAAEIVTMQGGFSIMVGCEHTSVLPYALTINSRTSAISRRLTKVDGVN